MLSISRRELLKQASMLPAAAALGTLTAQAVKPGSVASAGWSWEGHGFTGGAGLSIFGVGEGARYWGLKKAFHMWRQSDELGMGKLGFCDEVICEVSKTRPIRCGDYCIQTHYDPKLPVLLEEVKIAAHLSLGHPNITGVYIDDTLGKGKPSSLKPDQYQTVHETLTKINPKLKLWALVFATQLAKESFTDYLPNMDVINLWIWNADDLREVERNVEKCREVFPDKPINLGCFLWDFPSMKFSKGNFVKGRAVPMEGLKNQWERIPKWLESGHITGYSILAAFLIDAAQEQARWIRDFIAAN
ncbi:MAG TPA: twin-arginine translocation signal domain-containing protein [Acidobacteriota bacterium]|jgi:hypothetical protein